MKMICFYVCECVVLFEKHVPRIEGFDRHDLLPDLTSLFGGRGNVIQISVKLNVTLWWFIP